MNWENRVCVCQNLKQQEEAGGKKKRGNGEEEVDAQLLYYRASCLWR